MSLQVVGHQTENYRISTTVYEGPLDLLLELIERSELDITKLSLAQVTDQYLAYLHNLPNQDPAEVSAFLVMAARLLQIKSSVLLPRAPLMEALTGEEDPAEALARQLLEYRRFKQLTAWLQEQLNANRRTYLRVESPIPHVNMHLDMEDITLNDLSKIAYQVFIGSAVLPELSKVLSMPRITIRDKIKSILQILRTGTRSNFLAILSNRSRIDIVVTFLAMLELIKRRVIEVQQNGLFDVIELQPASDWNGLDDDEPEIEFNE